MITKHFDVIVMFYFYCSLLIPAVQSMYVGTSILLRCCSIYEYFYNVICSKSMLTTGMSEAGCFEKVIIKIATWSSQNNCYFVVHVPISTI